MSIPLEYPRHVHKDLQSRIVADETAYAEALQDGWSPVPVPVSLVKGEDFHDVYDANQLAVALAQGWTVADAPIAATPSKPVRKPKA